jgi:hypothetical protein
MHLNYVQRHDDREDARGAIRLHVSDGRIVHASAEGEGGENYECRASFSLTRRTPDGNDECWCCPSNGEQCYTIPCGSHCP